VHRTATSGNGRQSYNAISFLSTTKIQIEIQIAKIHEISFLDRARSMYCSFLESIETYEMQFETCEIWRTKFLTARNLFRLNASTVCPFTINFWFPVFYAGLISNSLGQLSCTIAVYIRDWKCYIVHSDGEHEMLRYNWSHWLVTGITTSRYRRPTTNLLYLTVSYTLYNAVNTTS